MKKNTNWDLSKIFKNETELNNSIKEAKTLVSKLLKYEGNISNVFISSDSFLCFIKLKEKLNLLNEKIYIYSYLNYYSDALSKKANELIFKAERLNEFINTKLSFILPEMLNVDYEVVKTIINTNEETKKYKHDLETVFRHKKYTLSEKEEKIIADASSVFGVSADAFSSLNNADIKFGTIINEKGIEEELTHSKYGKLIENTNKNIRKEAFVTLYEFYKNHINTISNLYVGKIKEDFFYSKVRKYKNPLEASLYNDNIDIALYENLIKATNENITILNKYLNTKKNILKLKNLNMYDLYVNPVKLKKDEILFEEGKQIIINALYPLGNDYLNKLNKLFENKCIDIYPRKGKRSGAFEWGIHAIEPFVSLEYENNINSVSTLIHELGHAMHSYYSYENQSYTYSSYPIFLAEIASTVNEILLSEYLYKNSKTKKEKEYYLIEFLDKFRATVYRQVMFSEYEYNMHNMYEKGESITKDVLCDEYYKLNKKYYKNIINNKEIMYEWARIPHFYTPFYVYKYATGFISALIIVNKLLTDDKFKEKYIEFLSSGSKDYPLNILKKLGVDITNKDVLGEAFNVFNGKLSELNKLIKE